MALLSQKAKEDLEIVTMICSNLQSIIILKNRNSNVPLDPLVIMESENKIYPIPNNSEKPSYKNNLYLRSKNIILYISKKIINLFHF